MNVSVLFVFNLLTCILYTGDLKTVYVAHSAADLPCGNDYIYILKWQMEKFLMECSVTHFAVSIVLLSSAKGFSCAAGPISLKKRLIKAEVPWYILSLSSLQNSKELKLTYIKFYRSE